MNALEVILIGALGSALQELLHWYGLREHLSTPRYKQVIKSASYWIVTGLMIVGSGVAVWLWFADEGDIPARQYLVLGAALPLIFKKAVDVVVGAKPADMSRQAGPRSTLGAYFRGGVGLGEERLA
ncbi:hypothetical protein HPC49_43860 [Pyxidicoccus fallax]|uniref:Uncharacterized protein n=1 Tax=Pyxidicoccus fallax TaxID=394095 RepID=A0A848LUL2_9BACT|nr:hypothetical protein [Pyxidicoccus fallax]NMO21665.1 hypothetical protein [Pyxidicoccus fallax]NPC85123.1 hypothetical protein [Pyxidicoccus fallax]